MSLESKIEKLTTAIEELTEVIIADVKQDLGTVEHVVEVAEEVVEVKSSSLRVTHDDLKEELLKAARRDRKNECKELLAEYGATKVSQIKEGQIEEVLEKAKGL